MGIVIIIAIVVFIIYKISKYKNSRTVYCQNCGRAFIAQDNSGRPSICRCPHCGYMNVI